MRQFVKTIRKMCTKTREMIASKGIGQIRDFATRDANRRLSIEIDRVAIPGEAFCQPRDKWHSAGCSCN